MRLVIFILLICLGLGYFIQFYILQDVNLQWYAYFVTNDLKAFLISIALLMVTYKTRNQPFALCAASICTYDLATQVLDKNVKGNWAEAIYIILLTLIFVYFFVRLYADARANH